MTIFSIDSFLEIIIPVHRSKENEIWFHEI